MRSLQFCNKFTVEDTQGSFSWNVKCEHKLILHLMSSITRTYETCLRSVAWNFKNVFIVLQKWNELISRINMVYGYKRRFAKIHNIDTEAYPLRALYGLYTMSMVLCIERSLILYHWYTVVARYLKLIGGPLVVPINGWFQIKRLFSWHALLLKVLIQSALTHIFGALWANRTQQSVETTQIWWANLPLLGKLLNQAWF